MKCIGKLLASPGDSHPDTIVKVEKPTGQICSHYGFSVHRVCPNGVCLFSEEAIFLIQKGKLSLDNTGTGHTCSDVYDEDHNNSHHHRRTQDTCEDPVKSISEIYSRASEHIVVIQKVPAPPRALIRMCAHQYLYAHLQTYMHSIQY